jgi:hypothetical protein
MDDFEKGICSLHDEAGGALAIQVCRPAHVGELLATLICGDDQAAKLLSVIRQVSSQPPAECITCDKPLMKGQVAVVAVVLPLVSSPRNSLVCVICEACGRGDDGLLIADLASYLKTSVWPELRMVDPEELHPRGGRA